MYQTAILDALNVDETLGTDVGKAVRDGPQKMGSRRAPRGAVSAQSLFYRPLGLHGPLLQSLVLFGACLLQFLGFFLHMMALDLPGKWAFSPGLMSDVFLVYF